MPRHAAESANFSVKSNLVRGGCEDRLTSIGRLLEARGEAREALRERKAEMRATSQIKFSPVDFCTTAADDAGDCNGVATHAIDANRRRVSRVNAIST